MDQARRVRETMNEDAVELRKLHETAHRICIANRSTEKIEISFIEYRKWMGLTLREK